MYTIAYKSLDETGGRYQGTMRPCLNWPRPLPGSRLHTPQWRRRIRPFMSSSTHLDAQKKQIVVSLATKEEGATTQSERYARTQCLVTGPG